MPIIAIDLDDGRTALLDALAKEERRSRKSQLLKLVEDTLDSDAERIREDLICPADPLPAGVKS